MEFKLLTYVRENATPRAGLLVEGEKVVDLEACLEARHVWAERTHSVTVLSILENWDRIYPLLENIAQESCKQGVFIAGSLSDFRLAAPILYPHNIYCAAANYIDHSKEMADRQLLPDKRQGGRPYFFFKTPRQAVIGPQEPIRIPSPDARVDWEAELGVVICRPCRKVSAKDALNYVAGFTIIQDVSDRARLFRADWKFGIDWFGGKSFDTSAPMGPWITPCEFISDPQELTIQLWVNDELMQNASSCLMYFTIAEQIEYLSELLTLLPGDIIATGTPAGVGHPRGKYLKPGDVVTITIEKLGTLRNPVIAGY
jgi:2-keto-4-pentenoate hydratase/2-oxohepta-3-ene-1,7-dioic acid hydratase in catechol pathway